MIHKKDIEKGFKKVKVYKVRDGLGSGGWSDMYRKEDIKEITAIEYQGYLYENENIILFFLNKDSLHEYLDRNEIKPCILIDILVENRRWVLTSKNTAELHNILTKLGIEQEYIPNILKHRKEIFKYLRKIDFYTYD